MTNNKVDELLKKEFQLTVPITEGLENRTLEQMQKKSERNKWGILLCRFKPVVAVLGAIIVLAGGTTGYAMINDISIGEMFSRVWGTNKEEKDIAKISTDVTFLSEENTFEKLDIEPVKVVSDGFVNYVVLKVQGKKGFVITDDMTFNVYQLHTRQIGEMLGGGYVLKREGNTLYYAITAQSKQIQDSGERTFEIWLRDMIYAEEFFENGSLKRARVKEGKMFDGTSDNNLKAAQGVYNAEINCKVKSDSIQIKTDNNMKVEISTLGVYVNRDIMDKVLNVDLPEEKQKIYVILNSGEKVEANIQFSDSLDDATGFLMKEPIEPEQVKAVKIVDDVYYR